LQGNYEHEEQAKVHLKNELNNLRQQHDDELHRKAEEWKKALERPISPKRKQRASGNTWIANNDSVEQIMLDKNDNDVIEVVSSYNNIRPNSASNLSTGSSVIDDVIKEEEEEDLEDEDEYGGIDYGETNNMKTTTAVGNNSIIEQ